MTLQGETPTVSKTIVDRALFFLFVNSNSEIYPSYRSGYNGEVINIKLTIDKIVITARTIYPHGTMSAVPQYWQIVTKRDGSIVSYAQSTSP